jgi:hypothetical protein
MAPLHKNKAPRERGLVSLPCTPSVPQTRGRGFWNHRHTTSLRRRRRIGVIAPWPGRLPPPFRGFPGPLQPLVHRSCSTERHRACGTSFVVNPQGRTSMPYPDTAGRNPSFRAISHLAPDTTLGRCSPWPGLVDLYANFRANLPHGERAQCAGRGRASSHQRRGYQARWTHAFLLSLCRPIRAYMHKTNEPAPDRQRTAPSCGIRDRLLSLASLNNARPRAGSKAEGECGWPRSLSA